ncbi:MAG: acetate--CoA ligase family protein, partial [Actinomycetota bacterium]
MADLARLLNPRSVAVIGGAPAAAVVRQCQKLGYTGEIWPVHPKKSDMHGVASFPTLADLPGVPDAAFVAVNRHLTIDAVAQLRALGAGGAVCYASGFAESGDVDLQVALLEAAGDMAILGPNCYGYVNALDGVALWPDEHGCTRVERGVGIISQSGNVGLNLTLQQRGLNMAYMVTVGNQAGGGVEDVLESFVADHRVTAIGMFIEAIREPQRFADIAIAAVQAGKRIVALQTGKSEAGALIAASHTASLAGNRTAYAALFARCGVATVETPTELVETLKLLDHGGPLAGYRMASLSCSGGEASLVADLSETTSLTFSPFPDDQRSRIEATLTELVSVANPFDYHTFMWGDRAAMGATFGETMDGPHDATMLVLDAPPGSDQDPSTWITAAEAFADAADRTGRRGVVVATMPECLSPEVRSSISARGIAPLQGLREALVALDRCAWLAAHAPQPRPAAVTAPAASVLVDEQRAKERLGSLGVRVPRGERARRTDVLAVASRVGYPVTLKGLGLAHKSEAGAVALGLRDATALEVSLAAMPESLTEFLVEETVTGIVAEVLVTVRRAAPLGWLITIGAGGVLTELWRDTQSLLAPTTTDEIRSAIERLRISAILAGYRGKPAGDVEALVAFVDHLQRVVVGTNAVEVELNPVLVTTSGAIAVDALLIE